MKIEVETKYDIGQTVYIVVQDDCSPRFCAMEVRVDSIITHTVPSGEGRSGCVMYLFKQKLGEIIKRSEPLVFDTRAEAQAEAASKNDMRARGK